MLKGIPLVKLGSLAIFSIPMICCAVLAFQVLCKESNLKAGIATLSFNFRLPNNPLVMPRDILQPLQSEAQSAANVVSTAISDVQSATAIPDINAVKALIPRNCSLGTKQFCVGFNDHTNCNNLPLNLSSIVPEAVTSFVGDQVQALQPLEGMLTKVTPANMEDCLILGLVLMFTMAVLFVCLTFSRLFCFASWLLRLGILTRMIIFLIFGLLCCIPFLIPTVILYVVQSRLQNLQTSIIDVEKGDVSGYCLGALCCAFFMMFLATVSPAFI